MTPEQIKAKELVDKLKEVTRKYVLNGEANDADIVDEAKECAIICVDEIVGELNERQKRCCPMDGALLIKQVNYYLKVKEEIQKL